jgi:hypothetical protein
MRVLLQNTETKLYFISPGEWTNDPLEATDFEEIDTAAEAYHSKHLAYAQIVLEPGLAPSRPQVRAALLRAIQPEG